uniref:C2H2-type domain-containing protein n=1 Tax=Anopheles epiroticus TaxID=199890 RepID=A0A2C9GVP3_9DIPT
MDKRSKKRKIQSRIDGFLKSKKLKPTEETPTPEEIVPAVVENAPTDDGGDTSQPVNDELTSLRENISYWLQQQQEYEKTDQEKLEEASNHGDEEDGEQQEVDYETMDITIGVKLAKYSDEQIRKSYKYECEWRKCKFMSGNDRKYFLHVESHGEQKLSVAAERYTCEWDLCEYSTADGFEFTGHVHYHAYHTKLKVHGASLHKLAKLPPCCMDSRMRNTITNQAVTFQCEWDTCTERFDKILYFIHHIKGHVDDSMRIRKRDKQMPIVCQWSLCKEFEFAHRVRLVEHMRFHTKERDIACFNCGAVFIGRCKYAQHCFRQIDVSLRKYQCDECGRYFATHSLLNTHQESHILHHQCTMCPSKHRTMHALANHVRFKHLKQRDFKCPQCDYAAFTRKDLMSHMLVHDGGKRYRCEEFGCNVVMRSLGGMKRHIAWHYNLPVPVYTCHLCDDKKFSEGRMLSKHLLFKHELSHPPGRNRFRYRLDSDGMYRLDTFVTAKLKEQKADKRKPKGSEDQSEQGASKSLSGSSKAAKTIVSTEPKAIGRNSTTKLVKPKPKETPRRSTCDAPSEDAAVEVPAPSMGNINIRTLKMVGRHKILVEMGVISENGESLAGSTPAPSEPSQAAKTSPDRSKDAVDETEAASTQLQRVQVKKEITETNDSGTKPTTTTNCPKDVKDFMVMKRYLKSGSGKSLEV